KLEDGGSVFYKAKRLGKNGKPFKMLKFRSMKENAPDIRNADGTTYSSPDDPRLTKIGKVLRETSIDELPQFLNVLIGQMSVLGPRPDPIEWFDKSSEEAKKKYLVKPGVSGYSQAYFRNTLPLEEKNKNEVYYLEHISFWFDIKIFFKTIERVLKRGDVYREDLSIVNVNVPNKTNEATVTEEK
ncbi:MAG: sugar transferase, partial [Clostridiaceae bacterium]|nr:sugar transferase [Clostridiaceae bacterium]